MLGFSILAESCIRGFLKKQPDEAHRNYSENLNIG
jgi:hypothetical protein